MKRDITSRLRMSPGYVGTVDDAIAEIDHLRAELATVQEKYERTERQWIADVRMWQQECRDGAAKDARIAVLEEELYQRKTIVFEDCTFDKYQEIAFNPSGQKARIAELDRERLMRKLYEDAAKAWQPRAERAEARIMELDERNKHMDTVLYDTQVLLDTEDSGELITGPTGPISRLIARAERAEAERDAMREALNLARIALKNRDQSEYEVKVLTAIRTALNPSPAGPDRYVEDDVERLFEGIDPSPAGEKI